MSGFPFKSLLRDLKDDRKYVSSKNKTGFPWVSSRHGSPAQGHHIGGAGVQNGHSGQDVGPLAGSPVLGLGNPWMAMYVCPRVPQSV